MRETAVVGSIELTVRHLPRSQNQGVELEAQFLKQTSKSGLALTQGNSTSTLACGNRLVN